MDKCYKDGVMTLQAGAVVTKGALVKFSSGKVIATTAANDAAVGIALDGAAADEFLPVAILGAGGVYEIVAGGAITQGLQVTAKGTQTSASTDVIVGRALTAASASGDTVLVATQVGQIL